MTYSLEIQLIRLHQQKGKFQGLRIGESVAVSPQYIHAHLLGAPSENRKVVLVRQQQEQSKT